MNDIALTPAASAAAVTTAVKGEIRTLVVTGPYLPDLLNAVSVDMEIAPTIEVDSDDMAAELQGMLGRLSTVSAAIENERKQRKAPLLEAGKWLDDGYNPARDNLDSLIAAGKRKLIAWNNHKAELARKAQAEEQARLREEAQKRAQEEAAAIAAAQATAAAAAQAREEGSEQVAQALETQAMAAVDTARANASAAVHAMHVAPLTAPRGPAVKGVRQTWKAECTDKSKLLKHIGERIAAGDLSLINLVVIDPKAINALAKVQEENLNIPGLRPYTEGGVAIRKAAVAA